MIGALELKTFRPWRALATTAFAPTVQLGVAATECLEEVRAAAAGEALIRDAPLALRFWDFWFKLHKFDVLVPVRYWESPSHVIEGRSPLRILDFDGGLAGTTEFLGPMDSVPQSLEALRAWINAQGLRAVGFPFHAEDPGESFERGLWHTELAWFVQGEGRACPVPGRGGSETGSASRGIGWESRG